MPAPNVSVIWKFYCKYMYILLYCRVGSTRQGLIWMVWLAVRQGRRPDSSTRMPIRTRGSHGDQIHYGYTSRHRRSISLEQRWCSLDSRKKQRELVRACVREREGEGGEGKGERERDCESLLLSLLIDYRFDCISEGRHQVTESSIRHKALICSMCVLYLWCTSTVTSNIYLSVISLGILY